MLSEQPFVSLKELSARFPELSSMTLRRDIEYFESQGECIKVRGGARSMKFITTSLEESFNLRLHAVISELIGLEKGVKIIDNTSNAGDFNDLRFIAEPKALTDIANYTAQPYYQVFAQRNSFIPNLSIVDLLFNMGPEGLITLKDSATEPITVK